MARVQLGPEGIASVKLDASGNGTVKVGPIGHRETWFPETASASASSAVLEAACRIYVGPSPTASYFRDGTLSGSTGDSTDRVSGTTVSLPWSVWAVWSGGDVGAIATLNVSGTKTV